jgi:catechol 2,3-dioxygenase-like lactoylglutathione lyase family enzyme
MISGVRSVGVFVRDQDRAREFYTETMGFELVQDVPMGEGDGAARWIEVRPPDGRVLLVLFTPEGQEDRIGQFSNILFECDDIRRTHEELVGRGVVFTEEPREEFWGWWAVFTDPDGNSYGLGQRGE